MADKKFTLFHLSLVERPQKEFFAYSGSREDWLRFALRERFAFPHRRGELHWVPQGEANGSIVGLIQRSTKHAQHEPPERGGAEIVADEWQGAYVVVDPAHHDDGQKAAVENDLKSGKPAALLHSLARAINEREDASYHLAVEPLFDADGFWQFSSRYGNRMKWINFDFVVPNMWGTRNDLEKDLKETGANTGAQRVSVRFKSDDGVSTENSKVREAVEYVEKGAGTLTAKSLDGHSFNSNDTVKTTAVPSPDGTPAEKRSYFARLKDRILGREETRSVDSTGSDGSGSVSA